MRVEIKDIYDSAYGKYGTGAFNIFNAEQVHGVFRGARKAKTPVIVQVTPVARDYLSPEVIEGIISAAEKIYPDVTFAVHLDHGTTDHCLSAIASGFYQSVMIDASHESFSDNVRITKQIVDEAHRHGVSVEAELGVLSGVEDHLNIDSNKSFYTDPDQAAEFVSLTGCDSLAVAVGTSHGAYKFSGGQGLQLSILSEIQKRLPGFPMALHGASSVPEYEILRINRSGGDLRADAKGVSDQELLQAVSLGVCKINIATDMRLIWARVHREFFKYKPELFDMVVPGKEYMNELEVFVAKKCNTLMGKMRCNEQG
jgi:fructose-bisphosphate aldolase, class II